MSGGRRFRWIGLAVAASVLVACGGGGTAAPAGGETAAPPAEERVLNLFAWSEYVPQALLDGFTAETGIQVNYDAYASNEEMYAKIKAGASGYDMIQPSDYWVTLMAGEGMLEELDLTKIPNIANIDPSLPLTFDPDHKHSIPYQWGSVALAVNTDKVTTPITSYADLWNPEFADRLVLLDDERQIIGMALLTLGYDPNTTDAAELDAARAKLLELAPNIRLFDSDTPSTALLSEEADAGLIWNGEGSIAHGENPAIDYIYPSEGTIFWYDNLSIIKGAAHVDAALAFMDYVLRPEESVLITAEFPYSNPNKAALDFLHDTDPDAYTSYMDFAATNPPPEALANSYVLVDVGDATAIYDRIWTEFKTATGG
jgi:spermidine/putrescine-binding protein